MSDFTTPTASQLTITSSHTSPVPSGTVVRLLAYVNPGPKDAPSIIWTIVGPFSGQVRQVVSGDTFDWDTQGLRAGAYYVTAETAGDAGEFTATEEAAGDIEKDAISRAEALFAATQQRRMSTFGDTTPTQKLRSNELTLFITPATATANQDGVLPVSLQRTAMVETPQQLLWVVIRNRTNAIGWRRYKSFIDSVMCENVTLPGRQPGGIPYRGTEAFTVLKQATDLFLMHEAGVLTEDGTTIGNGVLDPELALDDIDAEQDPGRRERFLLEEERRLGRRSSIDRLRLLRTAYYEELGNESVLPYLRIIRERLAEIPLKGPTETPPNCYGILKSRLSGPVAIELLWNYWHEEGGLVQTLNAILARFQNRRLRGVGPDPLARFDLDPLRPLSNLFWGWAQDEMFRLTVRRRSFEYDHEYGLKLIGKAVPTTPSVDSRSRFLQAFHSLLYLAHVFFKEDDDTTIIADAFPVLNGLRETHLVLAEGAHNQFGDLPSTARAEMLVMEWLLARPEIREFLGGRVMVPYEEEWEDRVDMMKTMQGWTDVSIAQFRDLGVFGEQLVLAIRYGNWSIENDPQEAANWARYWRPEIQRYTHAYRSSTGIDLTERVDATMPSTLLTRRATGARRA